MGAIEPPNEEAFAAALKAGLPVKKHKQQNRDWECYKGDRGPIPALGWMPAVAVPPAACCVACRLHDDREVEAHRAQK